MWEFTGHGEVNHGDIQNRIPEEFKISIGFEDLGTVGDPP